MRRLLLLDPEMIQSGIWKVGKAAGLLWEEGDNIVFRDRGVRRYNGAAQQGVALTDQARDIAQAYVSTGAVRRAYIGTDTNVELFALAGGVWTKTVLGAWPTAGTYADLETWGTWVVATNGVDPVKVWKNTGSLVNLAGTPFTTAKIVKRKQPFLLAFNTNNIGDTAVEWSSDSNIESWTPSLANKAGNYNLRDLDSAVVAVEDIGNRLAVYSRSSMVLGTFIGGDNVWSWGRAVSGVGAISRRSVVTLDPYNYGLTRDGIFKTDGNSFIYVDDPAMLRYIRDTADFTKEDLFWGMADSELKCVTFNFLNVVNTWHQVSYYPEKNIFTKGNFQLTAGGRKEVFNFPLVASEDLKLGYWQGAEQHFGANVSFNLKTKPLDFGATDVYKIHQNTRADFQGAASIRVREHLHPEDPGSVVYDAALAVDNYFERDAKYFSYEFYGSGAFYLMGLEVFGIPGGVAR